MEIQDNITIVEIEPIRGAGIAHMGPYDKIGAAFDSLFPIIMDLRHLPERRVMAVLLDKPMFVPLSQLRSFAFVELAHDESIPAGTEEVTIEGGKYCVYTHIGSYDGLRASWNKLVDYICSSEFGALFTPSFELYVSNPMLVPEAELRTDIYIPIH